MRTEPTKAFPWDIKVIDPATGDIFWFRDVESMKQIKNIQKMRYEIMEHQDSPRR